MPPPPAEAADFDAEPTHLAVDVTDARVTAESTEEPLQTSRIEEARSLVESCEAELARKPEPARDGRLHYEIARAAELVLDDAERARQHYLEARTKIPDHVPTIRGARRVLVALGRHLEALPLFDDEARLVADPHQRALLIYEKGVLLEDRLAQRKEARRAYAAALEMDESNPTILKAFERSSMLAAEWDDVERALEREANAVSSDVRHRAALLSSRARIADARKADPTRAIALYQTALGLDPRAPGALAALRRSSTRTSGGTISSPFFEKKRCRRATRRCVRSRSIASRSCISIVSGRSTKRSLPSKARRARRRTIR